jgi:tetratricopeptide (TPR) repeat protein
MAHHLEQQLSHLEASGLVRVAQLEPDLEYLFRHGLIQDAVYESLLRQDRRRLHLAVGEALERIYPQRLDALSARLAHHFAEAGAGERALPYYVRAGDHAFAQYALLEAITNYSAGLDLMWKQPAGRSTINVETAKHLLLRKGRAFELRGEYDSALSTYEKMEQIASEHNEQHVLLAAQIARLVVIATPSTVHNTQQAIALADQAMALAKTLGDRAAEARILWALSLAYGMGLGDVQRAYALLHQSLAVCREMGMTEQLAYCLTDLGNMYAFTGQVAAASEAIDEAVTLWRNLNNLPMLAFALNVRGQMHCVSGRLASAITAAQEGLAICDSIDNVEGAAFSLGVLIETYQLMGDIGRTIVYTQQALEYANRTPVSTLAQFRAVYLDASLGACDDVAARIVELLQSPMLNDLPVAMAGQGLISLAQAELLCGRPGPAAATLMQIGEKMDQHEGGFDQLLWAGPVIANFALSQGDAVEALDIAQKTEAAMKSAGMDAYLPEVYLQQAKALLMLDRHDEASKVLQTGHIKAESTNTRFWLWRILVLMADLEPEEVAAVALRRYAHNVLNEIAATMNEHPDLRASFLALPEAAALLEGSHSL